MLMNHNLIYAKAIVRRLSIMVNNNVYTDKVHVPKFVFPKTTKYDYFS